jgi:predicted esterase
MARSQLVYQVVPSAQQPERATIITLHGYNGAREDLIPLAQSLGPHARIIAPEALNGVFEGRLVTGHFWYRMQELGYPEPGSLGDSLWELEQFLYDLLEAGQDEAWPPFLLGYDQGAVVALLLSTVIPEYLAGVIAIRGYLPDLHRMPIDAQPMHDLPVLLIRDPTVEAFTGSFTEEAARQLATLGARVRAHDVPGAYALDQRLVPALTTWLRSNGLLDIGQTN